MRNVAFLLSGCLWILSASPARAQDKPAKAAAPAKMGSPSEETSMMIQLAGKQLLDMAEDKQYPDAKLDFKPNPDVRSFAEQLLHAAKANMIFLDFVTGKKPDIADLPRANYKTRADIVKVLKQSIDDLVAAVKKTGDKGLAKPMKLPFGPPQMVSTRVVYEIPAMHMSEHYGQLVVYYRLNKVVPPATRSQGQTAQQQP